MKSFHFTSFVKLLTLTLEIIQRGSKLTYSPNLTTTVLAMQVRSLFLPPNKITSTQSELTATEAIPWLSLCNSFLSLSGTSSYSASKNWKNAQTKSNITE